MPKLNLSQVEDICKRLKIPLAGKKYKQLYSEMLGKLEQMNYTGKRGDYESIAEFSGKARKSTYMNKAEIMDVLQHMDVEFNAKTTRVKLMKLMKEKLAEKHYVGNTSNYESIVHYLNSGEADRIDKQIADDQKRKERRYEAYQQKLAKEDLRDINQKKNVEIKGLAKDDAAFKRAIYVLQNLKTGGSRSKKLYVKFGVEGEDQPRVTRIMDGDKMQENIKYLLRVLHGEEVPDAGFTSSDEDTMLTLLGLDWISFEWKDRKDASGANELPEDVNAYFPYLNTSSLNLERYGIYKSYDEKNYVDNCLIHAIRESGVLSDNELNSLRTMINTRYISNENLKYIANLFNIRFEVTRYVENWVQGEDGKLITKPIRKGDVLKYGDAKCDRVVKMLSRFNHYMILDKGAIDMCEVVPGKRYPLNQCITNLLNNGYLKEFETEKAELFMDVCIESNDLGYCDNDVRLCEYVAKEIRGNVIYTRDMGAYKDKMKKQYSNRICEYKNVERSFSTADGTKVINFATFYPGKLDCDIDVFFNELESIFGINPRGYVSLSAYTFDAFKKYGCLDGVYKIGGKLMSYFKKFIKGGWNEIIDKDVVLNDVVAYDLNSSYGTAMIKMRGIPMGKPKPFSGKLPEKYDYYVVRVVVNRVRDVDERSDLKFHLFEGEGEYYVDMYMWEMFVRDYELKEDMYDIVDGYYWDEGINTKIVDFVNMLYGLRSAGNSVSKVAKFMIAQIYGKSCVSGSKSITSIVDGSDLEKFLKNNSHCVLSYKRDNGDGNDKWKVVRKVELSNTYNIPQLAIPILSISKLLLWDVVKRAVDLDRTDEIYRIYTDSIYMSKCLANDINVNEFVGEGLGKFKVEMEANKMHLLNKVSYAAWSNNGNVVLKGVTARKKYGGI